MRWHAWWPEGRWGWVPAVVAGLLLRALFVWHHPRFAGDTLVYGDLAHNLLAHRVYGLTEERVRPTLIRLPGYPLFLALCFLVFGTAHYVPVLWIQVGVDLLGCLLLGDLARRMFGPRVGRVVLWMAALCPFTANYAAAALTETLSVFCVTLALWAFVRWLVVVRAGGRGLGWACVAGGALTGATLLRPDGGLLAAALVPAMLLAGVRGGRWRAMQGAVVASALVMGALGLWAVRNWRVFHVMEPLAPKYANDPGEPASLGFARWYRTWAIGFTDTVRVYWPYDDTVEHVSDLPGWAFDSEAQRQRTAELFARYNVGTSATPAFDAEFAAIAAERVRAHPVRYYALLPVAKLGDMWLRPRTELMKLPLVWWQMGKHPGASLVEAVYGALDWGLLGLAVVGWWRWGRVRWGGWGPVALAAGGFVVLRSVLLMTIDNSEPRYTLECFPVVLLLASVAVAGAANGARLGSVAADADARG